MADARSVDSTEVVRKKNQRTIERNRHVGLHRTNYRCPGAGIASDLSLPQITDIRCGGSSLSTVAKWGLEGIVSRAPRSSLSERARAELDQSEKSSPAMLRIVDEGAWQPRRTLRDYSSAMYTVPSTTL